MSGSSEAVAAACATCIAGIETGDAWVSVCTGLAVGAAVRLWPMVERALVAAWVARKGGRRE